MHLPQRLQFRGPQTEKFYKEAMILLANEKQGVLHRTTRALQTPLRLCNEFEGLWNVYDKIPGQWLRELNSVSCGWGIGSLECASSDS